MKSKLMRTMSRWLFRFYVAICLVTATPVLIEIGIRLVRPLYYAWSHKSQHYYELPNTYDYARYPYLPYMPRQHLRFRGHSFAYKKDPGTLRVLCVGDSTTFGWGVGNEEHFPAVLNKKLAEAGVKAEVINAGVSGTSARYAMVEYAFGLNNVEPDIVIISTGFNSVFPDPFISSVTENRGARWWHYFYLTYLLNRRFGFDFEFPDYASLYFQVPQDFSSQDYINYSPPKNSLTDFVIDLAVRDIEHIALLAKYRAANVYILPIASLVNSKEKADSALRIAKFNVHLQEAAKRVGATFVDNSALTHNPENFIDLIHQSAKGNASTAEILFEKMPRKR